MAWILANWKALALAFYTMAIVYCTHETDRDAYDHILDIRIESQKKADTAICDKDKAITKEANDALQKDRDYIAHRLSALKLQHPATCISVTGSPKLPASGAKHAGRNGISSDWLRGYAAEAEGYRSEVIVCKDFINKALADPSAKSTNP